MFCSVLLWSILSIRLHLAQLDPIHSSISTLLADFREQAQKHQLDDVHDEVLVKVRVSEQVQAAFHIVSHKRYIARGEEYRANVWWDDFDDDSCALALDGDDFVLRGGHARRAESVVGEDGAPDCVQGGWEQGRVQHAGGEGV